MMWKTLLLFLLFPASVLSQPVKLLDKNKAYDLVSGQQFYIDDERYRQDEILALIQAGEIAELRPEANLGFKTGAHWLAVRIDNQSSSNNWVLHFADALVEKVDLYVIDNQIQHLSAHYSTLSLANRLLPTGSAIKMLLQPGEQLLVLRVEADMYDQTAAVSLMQSDYFYDWAYKQIILYLLVLGGVVALSLYSLMLFFLSRDVSYGWYAMYSLLVLLYMLSLYGYLYPLLNVEHINRYLDIFILEMASLILLVFVYQLLGVKKLSVWLSRLFIGLGVVIVVGSGLSLFGDIVDVAIIAGVFAVMSMITVIVAAIVAIKKSLSVGWFILLAWLPLVLATSIAYWHGFFSHVSAAGFDLAFMTYLAIFLQMFILLLAVVNKINVLQRHKRLAEKQNHEKSHFIAAASHDLRQPLHSMGLFVSLLEKHVRQDGAGLFANIKISLAAANNLFNSVLDLSRLEAGVIKPEITSVNLDKMLHSLCKEFSPQAESKGIQLRYRAGKRRVFSDLVILERILRNLINNAINHTHSGGVLLASRLINDRVRVECWDTGQGIATQDLARIFDEFEQSDNKHRSKDTDKGLGLGLAIVRKFTQLLNIEVEVASRLQRGSVFRLILKHDASEVPDNHAMTINSQQESDKPFNYSIWLLDNDVFILQAMEATLTSWGCRLLAAESWLQLDKISKGNSEPDLFVVDMDLQAELNGFDVIELLRSRFSGLRVVMITGNTDSFVIKRASILGVQILYKPLNLAKLRYLLQQL